MLRERAVGETLWESLLPDEVRALPEELARVDEVLGDERFLAPFPPAADSHDGPADDRDRDVFAADVPQAPPRVGLRDVVQRR